MSLLNKIAISNGNKLRKAAANLSIATMGVPKVVNWNRGLQSKIYQKRIENYLAVLQMNQHPKRKEISC